MSPRPPIFISAVSRELANARQLVANTLTFLGYQPVWQDIFGTESGDLRQVLRQQIDHCKGLVQLVGHCYGAEPPTVDNEFGRVSYTQYEARYARQRGKKVWYLFIDQNFPAEPCDSEAPELRELQAAYRGRLQSDTHIFHPLTSREALEASVLRLRDDLTRLRRGVKQWAAGVAVLLLVIAALTIWLVHGQHQTSNELTDTKMAMAQMSTEMTKLRRGIVEYSRTEAQIRGSQTKEDAGALQERIYAELGKELNIDPKLLREKLPRLADELKHANNASSFERANAAYVARDYVEAERLALRSAEEVRKAEPDKPNEAADDLTLAGLAAQRQDDYDHAMQHLRAAEKLTDPIHTPEDWADVQFVIANVLLDEDKNTEAETTIRPVVDLLEKTAGRENPRTVSSRDTLASALEGEGKYAEAETEYRSLVELEQKLLGPEDPQTLGSRNELAQTLSEEGKIGEARELAGRAAEDARKVLGPDNPVTQKYEKLARELALKSGGGS